MSKSQSVAILVLGASTLIPFFAGLIAAEEGLRPLQKPPELKLENGQATYGGAIEEAAGENYRGKKSFKILAIKLEKGKTYQIDHISKEFQAFLFLEDAEGILLKEVSSTGAGQKARIVFHADKTGTYRLIVTSQGGFRTGDFLLSVKVIDRSAGILPSWFKELDKDQDGQVSLQEWLQGGKKLNEFRQYDLNGDGFITPEEALRQVKKRFDLTLENGQATYEGTIEEAAEESYRGKKSFKILTIELEKGKTYQIDHMSKAFDAYLYLEDADGKLLAQDDDGGEGLNSRIVFRADKTGVYRLIATSVGNSRPGAFSLSVRVIDFGGTMANGLPSWFKDLDRNQDGQVSLQEWLQGGKKISEFREYDRNGDGLITAEEVLLHLQKRLGLKLENGRASYLGTVEEAAGENYRGKKSFKIITIKLEQGQTYQIELVSNVFQAFLYLEEAGGRLLKENSSSGTGQNARIVFRVEKTGTYRLIVTSQGGKKTGDFSLSVKQTF